MSKAILISIKPEWVQKILNGDKTIEIRKTLPKCKYPIDVYIYCTKSKKIGICWNNCEDICGKVVAKFTLRKLEEFINGLSPLEREYCHVDNEFDYQAYENVLEKACLTYEQAEEYAPDQSFCAWHISDLEIFDEPKELKDLGVEKAPQSWRFIDV